MRRLPLLLVMLAALPGRAETGPIVISHNGYLLDVADQPVNAKPLVMSFAIWTDPQSLVVTNRVWPAAADGATCEVDVTRGHYTVMLGGGLDAGNCGSHITADALPLGAPRYLEVTVRGIALAPRLGIGTVPSAVLARLATDAQHLEGQTLAELTASLDTRFDTRFADRVTKVTASAPLTATTGATPNLSLTACPAGQVLRSTGAAWECTTAPQQVKVVGPVVVTPGLTPELSMPPASAIEDGYLTANDFGRFDAKLGGVTAPLVVSGINSTVSLPAATASAPGHLAAADFAKFSAKEEVLTFSAPITRSANTVSIGNATASAAGVLAPADFAKFTAKEEALTFSAPLARAGNTVSLGAATTSTSGLLTKDDWNLFNGKLSSLTAGGGIGIAGPTSAPVITWTPNVAMSFVTGVQGWFTQGNAWQELNTGYRLSFNKKSATSYLKITLTENVGVNTGGYWCELGVFIDGSLASTPSPCVGTWYQGYNHDSRSVVCLMSGVAPGARAFSVWHKSSYCYYGNYPWDQAMRQLIVEELPQ